MCRLAALSSVVLALAVVGLALTPAIPNASFTNGTAMPSNWSLSHDGNPSNVTAARDTVVFRSSPASLRVESSPSGWTEGFAMCQLPVALLRNKTFTVKGWTKKVGPIVHIVVQPFYTNGTNTWDHQLTLVNGYESWKQWEFTYTFANTATVSAATLNFFLDEAGTKVWMDDLELVVDGGTTVRMPLEQSGRGVMSRRPPESAFKILNVKGQGVAPSGASIRGRLTAWRLLNDQGRAAVLRIKG